MSSRPRKILLLAEAANPEWPSVPLIGWSLSQALAQRVDAHLVTHVRNREALLRAGLKEDLDFTAIDNEAVAGPMWKLSAFLRGGEGRGWTTAAALAALTYYWFEQEIWRLFRSRLEGGEFDLVHRITPLSPTHHSLIAARLAKLDIPFVLGPLNGGLPWPKKFGNLLVAEKEWLSPFRQAYKWLPHYRSTLANSAAIIVGARHVYDSLPPWVADRRVFIPENAVDMKRFDRSRERKASIPLRVVFVGRLTPYKGADMLIEATAEFQRQGKLELTIVGDGPERERLEAMVSALELGATTRFDGWVAHGEIVDKLLDSDLLALPSIREFGGGVVLEAMAVGVAPLVADYGGPSELVDDSTGIRVAFHDRSSLVAGLKHALAEAIGNPARLDTLGAAGREKVLQHFTWEAKADQIVKVYDAVLDGKRLTSLGLSVPRIATDSRGTNRPVGAA